MNKSKLIIIGIASVLVLGGAITLATSKAHTAKPKVVNGILFTDQGTGFSMVMPKGWSQVKPTPAGNIVEFNKKDPKSLSPTLNALGARAQGYSLSQYADAYSSANSKNFKDYKELGRTKYKLDDVDAAVLSYTATVDGYTLRYAELISVKNSALYQVAGASLSTDWPKYGPAIDSALKSVRLP